jgi:outer membrane protein
MKTSFGRFATVVALACAVVAPAAQAQTKEGNFVVRLRALHLDSANKDTTGLGLSVNNKTFPELDISYFFSPNFAAELILTYPQKHTLYSNGSEIGTLKHLPPTLTFQYHVPMGAFRPYVGLGLNATNFSDVQFAPAVVAALQPNVKRMSYGAAALRAGRWLAAQLRREEGADQDHGLLRHRRSRHLQGGPAARQRGRGDALLRRVSQSEVRRGPAKPGLHLSGSR